MIKQNDMTIQAYNILEMISQYTGSNIIEIVTKTQLSYESCEFLLTQLEMAGFILKHGEFYKRTTKRVN